MNVGKGLSEKGIDRGGREATGAGSNQSALYACMMLAKNIFNFLTARCSGTRL